MSEIAKKWYVVRAAGGKEKKAKEYIMKRDFLKNLGIEDNDVISKILDENSADIGRAKGELQTYKDKVTDLEGQVKTKDGEIANLQKKVGDTDIASRVSVQLQLTDPTARSRDRVVKKSEKDSLYAAMDVASVWLERALKQ